MGLDCAGDSKATDTRLLITSWLEKSICKTAMWVVMQAREDYAGHGCIQSGRETAGLHR